MEWPRHTDKPSAVSGARRVRSPVTLSYTKFEASVGYMRLSEKTNNTKTEM